MIPEDWKIIRLGEVAEIRGNRGITNFEKVAFVPMELVSDSQPFVKYQVKIKSEVKSFTYCEAGDLLLAKITPSLENGKQGILPMDIPNGFALATTEVFPLFCKGVDKFFLFYILKLPKFRNRIIASMIGTTGRQRASKDSIIRLEMPLPLKEEQQKIAEILSTVDEAIEKVDEAIDKTERLKKGLMQELLTKGVGHKEFKDSEIGRIPEEWGVVELGGCKDTEFVMGQSPPSSSYNENKEGLPFLQGKAEFRDLYPIILKYTTQPLKIAEERDILISVRAPVGDVNLAPFRLCIGRGLAAIRVKEGSVLFYFYWFQKVKKIIEGIGKGSTFKAITKNELKNFKIPVLLKQEQQKIAKILSTVDKRLELEKKRKEILEKVKKGLMEDLLTGRKRVAGLKG